MLHKVRTLRSKQIIRTKCVTRTNTKDSKTVSDLEKIVSLCKRRGFVFPGSSIYGGLAGSYDYGPLGSQLKKNIKDLWWNHFIVNRPDCLGVDTPILMRPEVWKASGHVENFVDPMVTCKICNHRFRPDTDNIPGMEIPNSKKKFVCPVNSNQCGSNPKAQFSESQHFNLLFQTNVGPMSSNDSSSPSPSPAASPSSGMTTYLRPETAQGIFILFKTVSIVMRKKLPFGIGQIGKSFRNEISPRDFLFRLREFEQMELEYFCAPEQADEAYTQWLSFCMSFLTSTLGLPASHLRVDVHAQGDMAHYARASADIQFLFPQGWAELWGVANRGDYDLRAHSKACGEDLLYRPDMGDNEGNSKKDDGKGFYPYVIEPAVGVDRLVYAALVSAFHEETALNANGEPEPRTVMKFSRKIAPYTCAVLPLMKKAPLGDKAREVFESLMKEQKGKDNIFPFRLDYDETGSIGKRYRRQDEIGTPYCVTIDFDTLKDDTITIRDRDSMTQKRIPAKEIRNFITQEESQ